ncbi:uncharacterized protein LOC142241326 [Haematobia irritans]|uniref:uncharacterized protein LOC142241326 n=1 Tax=Haematobia irritans TaxID=7368 RepID=UPI003F4FEAC0
MSSSHSPHDLLLLLPLQKSPSCHTNNTTNTANNNNILLTQPQSQDQQQQQQYQLSKSSFICSIPNNNTTYKQQPHNLNQQQLVLLWFFVLPLLISSAQAVYEAHELSKEVQTPSIAAESTKKRKNKSSKLTTTPPPLRRLLSSTNSCAEGKNAVYDEPAFGVLQKITTRKTTKTSTANLTSSTKEQNVQVNPSTPISSFLGFNLYQEKPTSIPRSSYFSKNSALTELQFHVIIILSLSKTNKEHPEQQISLNKSAKASPISSSVLYLHKSFPSTIFSSVTSPWGNLRRKTSISSSAAFYTENHKRKALNIKSSAYSTSNPLTAAVRTNSYCGFLPNNKLNPSHNPHYCPQHPCFDKELHQGFLIVAAALRKDTYIVLELF